MNAYAYYVSHVGEGEAFSLLKNRLYDVNSGLGTIMDILICRKYCSS